MKKRIDWKAHIITGLITLVIGTGIFLIGFFTQGSGLIGAEIGAGYAAALVIGFGGLSYVNSQGFFDVFAYGFKQFGTMLFRKNPNQENDYSGYVNSKNEARKIKPKTYLTILIIGACFLIAWFVLRLTLNDVMNSLK